MQVINLPPHFDEPYAEHAHEGMDYEPANHGQEEVYVPLAGRATMVAGEQRLELVPGMAVRVGGDAAAQLPHRVTSPSRCWPSAGSRAEAYSPPPFSESAPATGRRDDERQARRVSASPAGVRA